LTPGGSRAGPKEFVEFYTVGNLVRELGRDGRRKFTNLVRREETTPATPPDVLGRNEAGGLVGFEVTELTDQKAIDHNIPRSKWLAAALLKAKTSQERIQAMHTAGEKVCIWTPPDVLQAVTSIVAKKDAKAFVGDGEDYAERWLVIHTAEPFLCTSDCDLVVNTVLAVRQLDAACIIMDYDPRNEIYPCRLLQVQKE